MKKNKESVTLDIKVADITASIWKGDLQKLPANKTYQLIIDYPLDKPAIYKIHTSKTGMGMLALISKIGKLYEKTYEDEDATEDGGRYGIWGHSIEDLCLEGITVDHKKKRITLSIGS